LRKSEREPAPDKGLMVREAAFTPIPLKGERLAARPYG
jgi:hypothetical protein